MNLARKKLPGKRIKEVCAYLGEPYTIDYIDKENVIYRDLGEYDIEVSGLDSSKSTFLVDIYVWAKKPGQHIVHSVRNVKSPLELKDLLGAIACSYLQNRGVTLPSEE